nr:hypothetical protein [Tanacetum cinerariifolium]
RFGNDHFKTIIGYGDYVQGNLTNLEGEDLLTGSRDSNLYTIFISELVASSPNGVVERRNCTLVEAARTILIFSNCQNFFGPKLLIPFALLIIALSYTHVSSSEEQVTNEPTTPVSNDNADELVQDDIEELDENTFINPFATPEFEKPESSSNY